MSKLKPLGKTTAPKPKTKKPIYNPSMRLQGTKEGKAFLDKVRAMTPFDRLIHWITERHKVHCKRYNLKVDKSFGAPKWEDRMEEETSTLTPWGPKGPVIETNPPWTDDPILKTVFFCNPYRENDKVTAYLRDNFREEYKDEPCVFLGTILLRLFNYIPTMRRLINANVPQRLDPTSPKECHKALREAEKLLVPLRDNGEQMFSGAYIIKFFNGMRKVEALFQVMHSLVDDKQIYDCCCGDMSTCNEHLLSVRGMGPFYVYQIIGDLAFTHVLDDAADWNRWSFCGPGTARGLLRLQGIDRRPGGGVFERRIDKPRNWEETIKPFFEKTNKVLAKRSLPKMHMRDFTNCLCEYDKYCRCLYNERHVKRPYGGE